MKCIVRHKKTKYDNHCSFMHAHFYWGLMSGELQGQNTGGGELEPIGRQKVGAYVGWAAGEKCQKSCFNNFLTGTNYRKIDPLNKNQ